MHTDGRGIVPAGTTRAFRSPWTFGGALVGVGISCLRARPGLSDRPGPSEAWHAEIALDLPKSGVKN
jgi:hypothetical protein